MGDKNSTFDYIKQEEEGPTWSKCGELIRWHKAISTRLNLETLDNSSSSSMRRNDKEISVFFNSLPPWQHIPSSLPHGLRERSNSARMAEERSFLAA